MIFISFFLSCSGKSETTSSYLDSGLADSNDSSDTNDTNDTNDSGNGSLVGHAVVTTADWSNGLGALGIIGLETQNLTDNVIQNIHSDAVTVVSESLIFQINRLGVDSIRIYEWMEWDAPKVEWSTGQSSNPHSVAKCFDMVISSLYAKDYLAIYNLDGIIQGQIDLSAFIPAGDLDGSPEASSIVQIGTAAYVALQQLDFASGDSIIQPTGPGVVIKVDCGTLSILKSWEVGPNPEIVGVGNELLIRTGSYGNFDGGVRYLNTLTDELTPLKLEDAEAGVWYSGITATTEGRIAINGFDVNTYESVLLCGDINGLVEIERNSLSYFSHITSNDREEIWLSTDQGIRIFDANTCAELTGNPISTTLAPTHVSFY